MIVEGLLNLIYKLLSTVISPFNVPPAPAELDQAIIDFFGYLEAGKNLIALVLPINFAPFFAITLVIIALEHGYPFIMWVLRKIPFLGIE